MANHTSRTWVFAASSALLALMIIQLFALNRVIDECDGIAHYQVAQSALSHPHLFTSHWGRPLYTLIMCLPAQLGLNGVIATNIVLAFISALALGLAAVRIGLKHAWFASILLIGSHATWQTVFAGLTEPTFILFASLSLYCITHQKSRIAYVLMGSLILTRPEAIIVAPALALVDWIINRPKLKALPLYAILGASIPLIYTIVGFIFFDRPWHWVIGDTATAPGFATYGDGSIWHFYDHRDRVTSDATLLLALLGLGISIIRRQWIITIMAIAGFAIFVLHSVLWANGVMGSAGLTRLLATALPFICVAAIYPLGKLKPRILVVVIIIWSLHSHIQPFNKRFKYWSQPTKREQTAREFTHELTRSRDLNSGTWYVHWALLRHYMDIPQASRQHQRLWDLKTLKPSTNLVEGDIIVYDNITGFREGRVPLHWLRQDPRLKVITEDMDTVGKIELIAFQAGPRQDTLLHWKVGDRINRNARFDQENDRLNIDTRKRPYPLIAWHSGYLGRIGIDIASQEGSELIVISNHERDTVIPLPWSGQLAYQSEYLALFINAPDSVRLQSVSIVQL